MQRRFARPRSQGAALVLAGACTAAAATTSGDGAWAIAGRQGLVRLVIVPAGAERDRAAYTRQIERLCEPERSCFLNFYSNSTGAPLAVPLPDAIGQEATALFRRSAKNGTETFQWSCRLQQQEQFCF